MMATLIGIVTTIIIGIPFFVWGAALSAFVKLKALIWVPALLVGVALVWLGLRKRRGVPSNHLGTAPAGDEIVELRDESPRAHEIG